MRAVIFVAVLLLVCIAVVGFYQGWFQISTNHTDQQPSATFTLDKDKIQEDGQKAKDAVQGFGQDAEEETGD